MRMFAQIDENGVILQIARGFDESPFTNAVEIPADIAEEVMLYPRLYRYQDGQFVKVGGSVPKRFTSEERIAQMEKSMASILLEIAKLKGGRL